MSAVRGSPVDDLRDEVLAGLRGESLGVLVYGSQARGTAGPGSDIDVLQVVRDGTRRYACGRVDVTALPAAQLLRMSREGALFVLHLRCDGRVLEDPHGILAEVLDGYRQPASYGPFRDDMAAAATLLRVDDAEFAEHGPGLVRLALYLARSCAFVTTVEAGSPVTDAERFAAHLGDPALGEALQVRRRLDAVTPADLRLLAGVLDRYLDVPSRPPGSTLPGLVAALAHRKECADMVTAYVPTLGRAVTR
ncbi:MAG TPA: nucleotidyltransferase domain-containing protein [Pseudonocardiaceae bacterium]